MSRVPLRAVAQTAALLAVCALSGTAEAASCPGNPHAIGTSRVLPVNPQTLPRIGSTQYSQSLPLAEREVVLTFDDGPVRPYTDAVLKALADECARATFFLVGRQAEVNPDMVRKIAQAGHTIGTHSQNHPLTFDQMTMERTRSEIDDGIASVSNALGDGRTPAPFFRIPGLLRTPQVEEHLASRGIALWSTDADADDWYRSATPEDIVRKAISRLDKKGRGILLLHDIQPATAMAVPLLLRELKARGYRVVQAVAADSDRVASIGRGPDRRQARSVILHQDTRGRDTRAGNSHVQKTQAQSHRRTQHTAHSAPRPQAVTREPPRYVPTGLFSRDPRIADRGWESFRR